jgi:Phage tail tube protein
MTIEVGGAGWLGIAFETTLGTWVTPAKWIPIRSETLAVTENKQYRMNLRGTADRTGALPSYTHTEGDIVFEVNPEFLPYILYCARTSIVKSGAGPYVYTYTPAHVAAATTATGTTTRKTASLTINRGSNYFGYVGCSVGQMVFSTDEDGMLLLTASIVGTTEVNQAGPFTPSFTATPPISPGQVTLEIPTASARADARTANLTINDNLIPANRLNGTRSAAYQNWGEREITFTADFDFNTLTDYNIFRAGTFQTATYKGINGTETVTITLNATVMDSYPVNLAGLGEVNSAAVEMHAFYNTGNAYTIVVNTAENIT